MHGYTQPTVTWSSSVGAIAAPHLYRSPPAGIGSVFPGHRPVLPAPAYGWPPYAIGAMPYVGDGLFRPAVNHYTDTAISNDLSRLTLDHYSAAAAVHPQLTGLAPGPGVVPTLLPEGQVTASSSALMVPSADASTPMPASTLWLLCRRLLRLRLRC